jgi:hypothetical protein
MRTLQSLLNNLNLKQLIPAIRHIQTKPTLPFYALKVHNLIHYLPPTFALSLTRKITDTTLSRHQGPLSVWSPHHLQRIAETIGYRPPKRLILKNPFKSEELI